MTKNVNRYSRSMRLMHWTVAALVVSMLAAGSLMIRSLEPWQPQLLMLHKSTGLLVLLLALLRLALRLTQPIPNVPAGTPRWQELAASVTHGLMYLLFFVIPISGFLMQYFAARPVSFYGLWVLPASVNVDIERFALFRETHGLLTILLMLLIALHIAAVIQHQFIKKDQLIKRMW